MAEPWTQEQLEIERAREARHKRNVERWRKAVYVASWLAIYGLGFGTGYMAGHMHGEWDGRIEEQAFQERLRGGGND